MVVSTKAVYSAIFLALTMIVLAAFYIAQDAQFLGVVQIVVYTGAVMMLFLFVVMLVGVDTSESLTETLRGHRIAAVVAGIGFGGALIIGFLADTELPPFAGLTDTGDGACRRSRGAAVRAVCVGVRTHRGGTARHRDHRRDGADPS